MRRAEAIRQTAETKRKIMKLVEQAQKAFERADRAENS